MSSKSTKRVGLLGCGNIASIVSRYDLDVEVVGVYDRHPERAEAIAARLGAKVHEDIATLLAVKPDLVVEAASIGAVQDYAPSVLAQGIDLVVLSVGALADEAYRNELIELARSSDCKLRIPSGALFGLDNAKVARFAKMSEVKLRTTKSPASLGLPAAEKRCLFNGRASECIQLYPKNVNVAVALSLATGREAQIELWVDPAARHNVHEVILKGEFGDTDVRILNLPSPENPRTSFLAALSLVTLLNGLDEVMVVGT